MRGRVVVSAAIGLVAFIAVFAFVSHAPGNTGAAPASAAAMLALITAAAVGIERAIEVFWTVAGQTANGWWPFNQVFHQVDALEKDVTDRVSKLREEIERGLVNAANLSTEAQTRLAAANVEMAKLQTRLADLQRLAPGNQKVNLIAATVVQGIGLIQQHQPQIDFNFRLVDQSVAGLTDFVASFKDNPVRRVISIWAGALAGIAIAYFVRLDVFLAVLGQDLTPAGWWLHLEIALTGLIIGLGSNPTHELISALQEIKQYRASQNQPGPVVIETTMVTVPGATPGAAHVIPAPGAAGPEAGVVEILPAPPLRRFR